VDAIEITSSPALPHIDTLAIDAGSISGMVHPLTPYSGNLVLETSNDLTTWTPVSTNQITSTNLNFQQPAGSASQFLRAKVQ
jgi:hypothetical protein